MIDYFHIWVENLPAEKLLKHPLLYEAFSLPVGSNTGEIKGNVDVALYRNLKFKIIDKCKIDISGSLHKHFQDRKNHRDFSFSEKTSAIKQFCSTFNINPSNAILRSFEFGVNLELDAQDFINSAIIHQTTEPNIEHYNGTGLSKCFSHQQYILKMYDKSAESMLLKPMLRIEFKICKMIAIKETNIKTLSDLMDKNKFKKLKKYLVKLS